MDANSIKTLSNKNISTTDDLLKYNVSCDDVDTKILAIWTGKEPFQSNFKVYFVIKIIIGIFFVLFIYFIFFYLFIREQILLVLLLRKQIFMLNLVVNFMILVYS